MKRDAGAARAGVAVAVAAVLAGCTAEQPATPLPGAGSGPARSTAPAASTSSSTAAAVPGGAQLTSGAVRLTVRPQDLGQRPVIESYLGFFAAYADALRTADPRSAQLRRHSTPDAFADFSRSLAANARDGITLRGPVSLQPALRKSGSGALTVILVDCLDGTAQRFYDRSGKPTGQAGARRPIQVELINSPGPVRWIVGSVADGPATACERSGS
jgi:hypothetical protein